MENFETKNYEDGTYYYADVTADGMTVIVNMVCVKDANTDGMELENYLTGHENINPLGNPVFSRGFLCL
jgi:hypothetical protein